MFSYATYILVSCLVTLVSAIRVDWNTNKGPIVPPTPRTTVRPLPPYREPAPVWEDQSNDIPNPNPYVYILPPPSRPRPATNNYLTSSSYNNNNNYQNDIRNYGNVITAADINSYLQGNTNVAGSLAAQYIPNVGIRYTAVVPSARPATNANNANANTRYQGSGDKLQGKFNVKTKKYKAYEKIKYAQRDYYPIYDFALPNEAPYEPIFDQEKLLRTQQLPLLQPAPVFQKPLEAASSATTAPAISRPNEKVAYTKDVIQKPHKSKEKFTTKKSEISKNSIFSEKSR